MKEVQVPLLYVKSFHSESVIDSDMFLANTDVISLCG